MRANRTTYYRACTPLSSKRTVTRLFASPNERRWRRGVNVSKERATSTLANLIYNPLVAMTMKLDIKWYGFRGILANVM
ncbi:MAG: hypothetical protein ACEY26_00765 [Candidatus Hodgkinia cicadicola]